MTVALTQGEVTYTATYEPGPAGPRLTDLRLHLGGGGTITSDVLRRAPLAALHAAAVDRVRDTEGPQGAPDPPLPARFSNEEDYRRLLQRYEVLVRQGDRRPLHTLAAAMDTTHNATAARIKKARKRLNLERER